MKKIIHYLATLVLVGTLASFTVSCETTPDYGDAGIREYKRPEPKPMWKRALNRSQKRARF